MQSKKCRECQTDIPTRANKCSQCKAKQGNWLKRHPVWTVLIALFVLGTILSSGDSGERNKNIVSNNNLEDKKQEVEKKRLVFNEVISIKTSSNKNSETFVLQGGKQKLSYKTVGDFAVCSIYVLREETDLYSDGGIPVVMTTKGEEGETVLRKKAGEYYVSINTNTSCQITLSEER